MNAFTQVATFVVNAFTQVATLVRWDLVREARRRETIMNMTLFAVLILFAGRLGVEAFARYFIVDLGISPEQQGRLAAEASHSMGPIFFWVAALFAGTVGLNHSFAAEREGNSLGGIVTAPIDLGLFYIAKVVATWVYVMVMQCALALAYVVLFNYPPGDTALLILMALGSFTLAYVAPGIVLSAMTTALGGAGEVILRILVFVLMIPLIMLTFEVSGQLFGTVGAGEEGPSLGLGKFSPLDYVVIALAFSAIYLCAGYLLFPKVLEE